MARPAADRSDRTYLPSSGERLYDALSAEVASLIERPLEFERMQTEIAEWGSAVFGANTPPWSSAPLSLRGFLNRVAGRLRSH